jgi:hypothetical protein
MPASSPSWTSSTSTLKPCCARPSACTCAAASRPSPGSRCRRRRHGFRDRRRWRRPRRRAGVSIWRRSASPQSASGAASASATTASSPSASPSSISRHCRRARAQPLDGARSARRASGARASPSARAGRSFQRSGPRRAAFSSSRRFGAIPVKDASSAGRSPAGFRRPSWLWTSDWRYAATRLTIASALRPCEPEDCGPRRARRDGAPG